MTHGYEGGDLLAVPDELHADTFPEAVVWSFGNYVDLFEDDPFCMGGPSRWRSLVDVTNGSLFVGFVCLNITSCG